MRRSSGEEKEKETKLRLEIVFTVGSRFEIIQGFTANRARICHINYNEKILIGEAQMKGFSIDALISKQIKQNSFRIAIDTGTKI